MRRIFCQQIFSSPDRILRNTVVEQDNQNKITNLIAIENQIAETSHTLYCDGIISSEIISVALNLETEDINITTDFQYVNLNSTNSDKLIIPEKKPLLIDFESNDLSRINTILKDKIFLLENFSIMTIIAACTFYPNSYLKLSKELKLSHQTQLLLWKRFDLTKEGKSSYLQVNLV